MNDPATRVERIEQLLNKQLEPYYLEVIDDSHLHHGHIGAKQGMGHYTVVIDSPYFKNQSLIQCHKMVYRACQSMMNTEIHALSIDIRRNHNDQQ